VKYKKSEELKLEVSLIRWINLKFYW